MNHQNEVKRLVEDSLWAWEENRQLTSKTLKILGTFRIVCQANRLKALVITYQLSRTIVISGFSKGRQKLTLIRCLLYISSFHAHYFIYQ